MQILGGGIYDCRFVGNWGDIYLRIRANFGQISGKIGRKSGEKLDIRGGIPGIIWAL